MQKDIAAGNLTSAGQLQPFVNDANKGACYACLEAKACLDTNQGDTGRECSDSPSTDGGPAACFALLNCIVSTDCQGPGGIAGTSDVPSQENVNLCYCGGANPGSGCLSGVPNGPCLTQEATGLGLPANDASDILLNFFSKTLPGGIANAIFDCSSSNRCTPCL